MVIPSVNHATVQPIRSRLQLFHGAAARRWQSYAPRPHPNPFDNMAFIGVGPLPGVVANPSGGAALVTVRVRPTGHVETPENGLFMR
jgi:hypothetical protein